MEPNDMLQFIAKMGFKISRMTLLRWEKQKLIPGAARRALGRGNGAEAIYPDGSQYELLTVCILLKNGCKKKEVAEIREQAKGTDSALSNKLYNKFLDIIKILSNHDLTISVMQWIWAMEEARRLNHDS